MQDKEIRERIASFSRWHYQFDLRGNLTPIHKEGRINRHAQRMKYFFDPAVHLLGGSLEGKRVLDLACNAGFWSLNAVHAGCDYVLGIEGRQMHIDQANFVFEVKEVEKDRYDFVVGDIFETDFRQFGTFDVVLCLGLMYHISKHMDLMEKISEVNNDVLVIDYHPVPG
jgi:tRNA (mo5U34)-methyltransferase